MLATLPPPSAAVPAPALIAKLAAALAYAARGCFVVPLHHVDPAGRCSCGGRPGCKPGKHPRIRHWPQRATTDPERLRRWWDDWPESNVGLATERSGLVVIDVDLHGAAAFAAFVAAHDLPLSPLTATSGSGGRHYYYAASDVAAIASGRDVLGAGIDVRARGGLIVAPPSVTDKGSYTWDVPWTTPPAPLPPALLAALTRAHAVSPPKTTREVSRLDTALIPPSPMPPAVVDRVDKEAIEGYLADLGAVGRLAAFLEIPAVELGVPFLCALHDERNPSATLCRRSTTGVVVYHDYHQQGEPTEYLTLAEVYHAHVTGAVAKLPTGQNTLWTLRLFVDAGLVEPAEVVLPQLPLGASPSVTAVYADLAHYFGVRWLYPWETRSAPYAARFGATWGGGRYSWVTVAAALRTLREAGVIEVARTVVRTPYYLPGR
jgi:hypothetical protein